jgi:hypothetical protein
MLQITPHMKILVAVEPADFRRGIDGLVRLCRESLQQDPFSGAVFVFRNRRGTALKVLVYDGQGFWLCHKKQPADCTHFRHGTKVGQSSSGRFLRLIASGGLDGSPFECRFRRRLMSGQLTTTAPPRAELQRKICRIRCGRLWQTSNVRRF